MKFDLLKIKSNNYDKITPNFAELVGVIIGDGCIRYKPKINQYYIEIVGNKDHEKEYFLYLKNLIKKETNLNSFIKIKSNCIRLRIYSKKLVEYWIYYLNLPYNKIKGENIFIPEIIRSNTSLRNDCIRGITDTDGSLFLANKGYRNDYPTIEISTTSKKLAIQIKTILSKNFRIGFRKFKAQNYRMIYRISINGDKMVQKWVKLIGFSNTRNIKRYKKLKNGATVI